MGSGTVSTLQQINYVSVYKLHARLITVKHDHKKTPRDNQNHFNVL